MTFGLLEADVDMGPFQPGVSFGLGMARAAQWPYLVQRDIRPLTAHDKGGNSSAQRDFGPVKDMSRNSAR